MTATKPKLRMIEAVPVESNGQKMFALRDPSGIAKDMAVVSGGALFVMQYFDGEHELEDIRELFFRQSGSILSMEVLEKLVAELDAFYLLDNVRFAAYKQELIDEILRQPTRRAAHAGVSYPADPASLTEQLDGYYAKAALAMPEIVSNGRNRQPPVPAIIVPHIDLRVGGPCYSFAYRAIAEREPADTYVILGTGHAGLSNCYSCLPMDFETPLGIVEHDSAFVDRLKSKLTFDLFAEPFSHRVEHTIEFQVIFLQHLLGKQHSFRIVPVLTSYAFMMLTDERFKREKNLIDSFGTALKETLLEERKQGKKITVIASVDFSHVGPRYGDDQVLDQKFLQRVRSADERLISAISSVDAGRFVDENAAIQDRFRVCGFSPIHTLLSATTASRGELLKYEQGTVDDKESVVSYASAALYE